MAEVIRRRELDSRQVRQWVRRHRACWDVAPLYEMHKGRKLRVGFELQVLAQRAAIADGDEVSPRDADLFGVLRTLIEKVLPTHLGHTRLDIGAYDHCRRLRPETGWVPEVLLRVEICHKGDLFAPQDEEERKAVEILETALSQLGLHRKAWPRTKTA